MKLFLYFSAFIWLVLIPVKSQDDIDQCSESFLCHEGFCQCGSKYAPESCGTPDNKECEGVLLPLYDIENDYCGCCNYRCLKYLKEGDSCKKVSSVGGPPTEMCGAGLTCSTQNGQTKCVRMNTKCLRDAEDISNSQGMQQSPPDCDDEGNFKPMQCNPGGLCRCVDKVTGDPIALGFGISGGISEAETSEMNCQCAQSYHESLKQGCRMIKSYTDYPDEVMYLDDIEICVDESMTKSAFSNVDSSLYFSKGHSRCLSNGNYDPIQCVARDGMDGICTCVEKWSEGDHLKPNGTTSFIESIANLHCFDPTIHEYGYYRPCELAIEQLKEGMVDEERILVEADYEPICTPDGNYAKLQLDRETGSKYCSNMEGNVIESYRDIDSNTPEGRAMNCECALAKEYLALGSRKPECCANGNYKGMQCVAGLCFCVDQYGRQTQLEVDQMDANSLNCPDFCCDKDSYDPLDFCYEFLI